MFEIYRNTKNRQFHFTLKARNHQVILTSQSYKTKASCKIGIRSVQRNAAKADKFELKTAKNGRSYFTLNARNGEVIGSSQMYKSRGGRRKGIASVISNSADANIADRTS